MTEDCIETDWPVYATGYGQRWLDGRPWSAHERAWVEAGNEKRQGMVLHHLCGTRTCINTAHLQYMTQAEHVAIHARRPRQERCKRGHLLIKDNLVYRNRDGRRDRECLTCKRMRGRNWMRTKRAN